MLYSGPNCRAVELVRRVAPGERSPRMYLLLCRRKSSELGKHSETLTDHVMAPRNGGAIENPDLTGHADAPGRGAFMILYLKIEDERIAAAKYHTVGCGPTIASGSMLTEMIHGKSIS